MDGSAGAVVGTVASLYAMARILNTERWRQLGSCLSCTDYYCIIHWLAGR